MGTPWVYFDGKCSGCKYLNDRGYCEFTACIIPCTVRATIPDVKPKTNADRIRAMSDEELADEILRWFNWLNAVYWDDHRIINWLREEYKSES